VILVPVAVIGSVLAVLLAAWTSGGLWKQARCNGTAKAPSDGGKKAHRYTGDIADFYQKGGTGCLGGIKGQCKSCYYSDKGYEED
jgi:hypothetical protein